jgi:aminocarboxymuconate-semialdehyde decarboxylase
MTNEQPVIADLHCHIFPVEAAIKAGTSVPIENRDGNYWLGGVDLDTGLLDLSLQIEDMQRQGVARRALAIPPFTLRYDLPSDEGIRWARSINEGIAEAIAPHGDAFVGFATVPLQDVEAAVVELDYAIGQLGLGGLEIATHIAGVELDDRRLDPFWERAERLRIPILVHPHDPAGADRMGDYYLRNLVGNPVETALAGTRLIFGGVLERYADLRIILSHGGGALPQLVGRLLHGHDVRPEAKAHISGPLSNLHRLYFDTIVFRPEPLRNLVATVGASHVVLGTDYPFDMGEYDPVGLVQQSGLAQEDVATILGNGQRLLLRTRWM